MADATESKMLSVKPIPAEVEQQNSSTEAGSPPTGTSKSKPLASSSSSKKLSTGRWSQQEHALFLEGVKLYGKDWKKVQELVGTRSSTQARSHAQKVLAKPDGFLEMPYPPKKPELTRKPKQPAESLSQADHLQTPVFSVVKD